MKLRLTSWNVNSVRLREGLIKRFIETENPDILCLQETKVENEKFPREWFESWGYHHHYLNGQRAYHGVAILSKMPLSNSVSHQWCGVDHARHAVVGLTGGIELHNLYVPAGGDVPDREANPKFAHKLDMLAELAAWFGDAKHADRKIILVGDLNIAPLPTDVWSHKQLLDVVSHTPIEVEALERLRQSHDFIDAIRRVIDPETKIFSWWSYRARNWELSNRGRRLDHVWVSPKLENTVQDARIAKEARGWEKPSDHVPVTVDLTL
ncbi:MAG: exodeoxyribonuclease III [Pseudomonadota bacterium]